jgi:aspartyl protease family protein
MLRMFFIAIFALGLLTSMLSNCSGRRSSRSADAFAERPRVIDLGNSFDGSGSGSGGMTVSDGAIELQRNSDGHFYADVQVNGSTVHALVDTGASEIALSRADASAAGLATSIGMPNVVGEGADGDVHGEVVKLDRVILGHKSAEGLEAVVLSTGEQSLLGQSFLSKFASVEIHGDTMVLR